MAEIKSSGTVDASCQHVSLTCELMAGKTPTANTSVAFIGQFRCADCGVALFAVGPKGQTVANIQVPLITTAPVEKPQQNPKGKPPDPAKGLPGTEMLSLTVELGIVSPPGCGCKSTAALMDRIGVAECRSRSADLRMMIAGGWEAWQWKDKLKAIAAAAWNGAGLKVSPTDPVRDLLELSFERAEAKMTKSKEQA